jgi:hypothetical protein
MIAYVPNVAEGCCDSEQTARGADVDDDVQLTEVCRLVEGGVEAKSLCVVICVCVSLIVAFRGSRPLSLQYSLLKSSL